MSKVPATKEEWREEMKRLGIINPENIHLAQYAEKLKSIQGAEDDLKLVRAAMKEAMNERL
jgi:hypothetical protein